MDKRTREKLARLQGALEGVKLRDAARLAEAQRAAAAIAAERDARLADIAETAADMANRAEAEDLTAVVAFHAWAAAERGRVQALEARLGEMATEIEALRTVLARSNGRAEAAARLSGGASAR